MGRWMHVIVCDHASPGKPPEDGEMTGKLNNVEFEGPGRKTGKCSFSAPGRNGSFCRPPGRWSEDPFTTKQKMAPVRWSEAP